MQKHEPKRAPHTNHGLQDYIWHNGLEHTTYTFCDLNIYSFHVKMHPLYTWSQLHLTPDDVMFLVLS